MTRQENKQEQFIAAIAPYAQEVQRKYGVPASIAIAQAALETGWGKKVLGNNLFGIKAGRSWQGATIDMRTHEYVNGVRIGIVDKFRAFANVGDAFDAYGKFLTQNVRYSNVVSADNGFEAADALQRAGYATDPEYASSLKNIITSNNLTRFDDASYSGYMEGGRFEQTRHRLKEQRESNPGVWGDFIKGFLQLVASMFSGVFALITGGDEKAPTPPLPTPIGSRVAGISGTLPPRG